jgi:hypothetical protein
MTVRDPVACPGPDGVRSFGASVPTPPPARRPLREVENAVS